MSLPRLRFDSALVVGDIALRCPCSGGDRKSTRLNSSHRTSSYAVFCLKKKTEGVDHDTEGPQRLRPRQGESNDAPLAGVISVHRRDTTRWPGCASVQTGYRVVMVDRRR